MQYWVAVAGGGAVGALLRGWVSQWALWHRIAPFPGATALVNIIGCLLIGLLWNLLPPTAGTLRGLILTGLLGALTTFSTYALETVRLLQTDQTLTALFYLGVNNVIGLAAVWLGLRLGG
ncbi:MAG: fluoride efflux transporter CrcB [Candidatus Dadabacteria bacterium]|nr:MAG: fluoride efflux transporter CrcB [Candidatus Dadabacteria bacterium]